MIARLLPLLFLLLLRFYELGIRPPHHDESVNGWFVDGILSRGYYSYDPANYHGPLFFYVLTFFEQLFGRSVESLRLSTVIFASLISFTPFLFQKWLGKRAAWIAAYLFALSPAMIFYSRYAIHETPFALACIIFFYFWLKVKEEGFTTKNIYGFGLSLGAMATLKENFVLYGASLGVAEALVWAQERRPPVKFDRKFCTGLVYALAFAAALVAITFTGFFQDMKGIPNFFKAFLLWFQTGEKGNGHQKPFYYWIKIMAEFESFALFGLLLTPLASKKGSPLPLKLLSVMSAVLWLLYSGVAYKTPWCMLSFYWGLILVASYFISLALETRYKFGVLAVSALALIYGAYRAYDVAYAHPDQEGHPYIYGQTFHDMMGPLNEIVERGKLNPSLHQTMKIQVISSFTWPLPYVLGEFKQVGYYTDANTPLVLEGEEVMMDKSFEPQFSSRLKGNYQRTETRSRQWAGPIVFFHKISP